MAERRYLKSKYPKDASKSSDRKFVRTYGTKAVEQMDPDRARRERVAKAKRIKGETVVPKKTPKGFARNPDDLGKLIKSQQRKKPY